MLALAAGARHRPELTPGLVLLRQQPPRARLRAAPVLVVALGVHGGAVGRHRLGPDQLAAVAPPADDGPLRARLLVPEDAGLEAGLAAAVRAVEEGEVGVRNDRVRVDISTPSNRRENILRNFT